MPLPFTDRRVLLTGAGGSIGSAMAQCILRQKPRALVLLDHSEANLHQLSVSLAASTEPPCYSVWLGDVSEEALLAEIFDDEQPEIVLHAAAYKHVPLMESQVLAAVRNNALGSNQLAKMAAAYGAETAVMVSTDKAVEPRSVMGASKRVAELALLRWSTPQTAMRAVRLGNVLGSQGSVVPAFLQQIALGGPVTVTHPEANRFFFRMEETVELITAGVALAGESGIYIPQPREPVRILDLAQRLIREHGQGREISVEITGLRPGDKLTEVFFSRNETVSDGPESILLRIDGPTPPDKEFDMAMESLRQNAEERDVAGVLDALCRLVPDYRPSQTALASRNQQEHFR